MMLEMPKINSCSAFSHIGDKDVGQAFFACIAVVSALDRRD